MPIKVLKEFKVQEFIQGSEEDIDYNKNLKNISQIYLEKNNFDLGKEENVENMSKDDFIEYIESKSEIENTMLSSFRKHKIDINFRSLMSNIYTNKITDKNIFIFFLPTDENKNSVGIDVITNFTSLLMTLNCKDGLIVTKKDLTTDSIKKLKLMNISPEKDNQIYNISYYVDNTFLPICQHALVPKVLKIYRFPEDTDRFIKENKDVEINKFPRLRLNDPLVKFYRGNVKDIFKLERKNINEKNILNTQIIYRIVVNTNFNKSVKK